MPTHRLWERCDVNCRFLQFSAVWALLYEHCVRVLARSPLVVKKTKQTSRDKAVRSTATSVGLGRFSFPWDSADGSFIRLGVKVTVASECFLYPAGMWQTQGLWDCSEIQVTDRSQDFLVRNYRCALYLEAKAPSKSSWIILTSNFKCRCRKHVELCLSFAETHLIMHVITLT